MPEQPNQSGDIPTQTPESDASRSEYVLARCLHGNGPLRKTTRPRGEQEFICLL